MRFPFVSRDRYDDLRARYDALEARYHDLKLAGATPPPRKATVTPPPPSPEAVALQRRHDELVARMAEDLQREHRLSPDAARERAEALRRAALGFEGGVPGL